MLCSTSETSQSTVCQWHKQVLAGEHMESEQEGREKWRIYSAKSQNISSKLPLLLCNNLLLLFFLSLANQLPGKTRDSPINNERGEEKFQQLARV